MMSRYRMDQQRDRITLSRTHAEGPRRSRKGWRRQIWSVSIMLAVIMVLCWTVVQLNEASSAPATAPAATRKSLPKAGTAESLPAELMPQKETKAAAAESAPAEAAQTQGPAINLPEEVVAMFQQRQDDLERREKTVRISEDRLSNLRAEIEQILSKVEAAEQRRLQAKEQQEKVAAGQSAVQKKQAADEHAQRYAQLTKIYESMPAEEAAARLEKMADRKALEILRLVKGKTAGAILAQVKVDRAAKLTEQLLSNP
jgi:flagellar motility protein MotE (MotC chaperone)